ncbi:hypothetical protein [Amorphus sp. MBR-141]
MAWRALSTNEAETHALYGVKGWLRVFLVLFLVGGLVALLELVLPAPAGYAAMFGSNALEVARFDAVAALLLACVALIGFARAHIFGAIIVPALIVRFLAVVLAAATFHIEGPTGALLSPSFTDDVRTGAIAAAVVVGGVACALLCTYFVRSTRVNVTFRHRAPARPDDPPARPDPWARIMDASPPRG